ncbi:MAG TPA: phosphoribosylformylglycinamidine synthase subunit PurL, partial [Gemmatimonadaceae bacterium]|nr:phosphoribosylformylglycinamidine synthase subunit PurL [Gemmatimonadaceae bacterium]
ADLSEESEAKRPQVQVGDPFTEKLLLEASLELIRSGAIVAIQDMGAAGLVSSSAEMAARGDVGVTIDTTKMPVREPGMTPYEILLSESQERMLVVAKKGREDEVHRILHKWDLTTAVIGEVIAEPVYRVTEGDRVVAEFPGTRLVTDCPTYTPPAKESAEVKSLRDRDIARIAERPQESDPAWTLKTLLSAPTIASKSWVYRQYDSTVRTNTVIGPGGDAAALRIRGSDKALAVKTDCNGRYCYLDPRQGARIAVAESARNVACVGGRPKAITNNLNFGNPRKPEVYFQLSEAVAGMKEACDALGTPVTGGNVSLYNESPVSSVYPTPVIGMVGVIDSIEHVTRSTFAHAGDEIVLLGDTRDELGGSEYLHTIHGLIAGRPPVCDLQQERALIDALLESITAGAVHSAHDCSEGGLAVALAECTMMNRMRMLGAEIDLGEWASLPLRSLLFGESQGRVIVSSAEANTVLAVAKKHGVPARRIGWVRDWQRLEITVASKRISVTLADLADAYHDAIPKRMSQSAAPAEAAITAPVS